jgi:hypothetical protein
MKEKYDGWAMQKPSWNNYIDISSSRRTRSQCIKEFEPFIWGGWTKAKKNGWRCIKVRLVPVSE